MKKQKPLAIVALTVIVLVIAYFVYDHFRPRCDSIFEQTSSRVGGRVGGIKTNGELFVGREKVQELAEGSQKVALHLKTCCVAQQNGILTPAQFQGCMDGAKDYESKILQVSTIIGEAQAAKDQGNQLAVDQKAAQAKVAVAAASDTVSQLGKVVASIAPSPKPGDSGNQPGGTLATEKHTFNISNEAGTLVTISINGTWVGQWDTHTGTIPLATVLRGKNELTVELQDPPQKRVEMELWAERSDGRVNLVRLNFQGKAAGKYTYFFIAR